MPGIEHRTVTPLLEAIRIALRGKKLNESLRYADTVAARTQPLPNLPGGPHDQLSKVYYYTRDARRLVKPPVVVLQNKLGAPGEPKQKILTPGKLYLPKDD